MADTDTNPPAQPEPRPTLEPSPGPIHQLPQASPLPPALPQESAAQFVGWETIGGQNGFYNVRDCLFRGYRLASEKLKGRKEDDVVIFDYSLDPCYQNRVDGNLLAEQGGPSLGHMCSDKDIFFWVPRNEVVGSREFDQITKEPRLTLSRGPRLGVIDFAQCYDTSDENLLNSIAEKLDLPNPTTFKETHSKGVLELPGYEGFRTGVSLRARFEGQSELAKTGSSGDRFTLFVSFPYFGKSSPKVQLGAESESIRLPDFKHLGAHIPSGKLGGDGTKIGEVLVHQARYMIFDNYTMAIFRSKEDSAQNKVPLHFLQERVGAFHAMIHMTANNTDLETWILGELQASLCKLEDDIGRLISDTGTPEGDRDTTPGDERVRRKRKRTAVQKLLTSLNSLSADLFAAISVAERQVAILDDLRSLFSASYRTETKNREKRSSLERNPSYENVALIPNLAENPEQMWQNTMDTINQVVQERKSFIKRAEKLIENMEIRRKILFGFFKSDHAEAATQAMRLIERTIRESQATLAEQDKALLGFTFITIVFLPLNFFTSYFGMNNITESDMIPLSLRDFWLIAGPISTAVILLSLLLITWTRPTVAEFRTLFTKELSQSPKGKTDDIENQGSSTLNSQAQTLDDSTKVSSSLHLPCGVHTALASGVSKAPQQVPTDPDPPSEQAA